MRRHRSLCFSLLAASVIAAAATAQAPPSPPPAERQAAANDAPQLSDAQLGLEARVRLYEGLGISNLSVLVRQGVATVDGWVPSEAERQRAEELVREVQGIDRVVNELNVADPLTLALADEAAAASDRDRQDVENMVTEAITADAVLGSRRIEVVADELTNTVTLTGTVTTEEEKERAGQIAVSAFPAGTVRNQLEVRQRL
jgi:osmotically-inducible protein OsmY